LTLRFGPAPTGSLHVGGVRTAIFNWLYARKHGGRFLLRIEDTDLRRSTDEAVQVIIDGLRWLGLDWDNEEIVYQSKRLHIYREHSERLISEGKAYYCYCTPEELEERRRQAQLEKRPWKYDGRCRDLSESEREKFESEGRPKVVRFRVPEGRTSYNDLIHGPLEVDNDTIGDFVIMKSDGSPTYQLAVTVDDALMGVTLVIRGDDHISNTPKQIMLYEAFGYDIPRFAHVPLILGPDKAKLSKRHGATSITEYRERGYLPEALFNFLVLLGWSPGDDREKMDRDEIIEAFSIEGISKRGAVFDERKLEWLNGLYIKEKPPEELLELALPFLKREGLVSDEDVELRRDWLLKVMDLMKERVKKLTDFAELGAYFFRDPEGYEEKGRSKHWKDPAAVSERLSLLRGRLSSLERFDAASIESAVRTLSEELGISAAKLIHPTRLAVSGMSFGPGLFEMMELIGKERVLKRLEKALDFLRKSL